MYQVPIIIIIAEPREPYPLSSLHADFAAAHVVVGDGGQLLGGGGHGEQGAGLGNHEGADHGLVGAGVVAGGVAAVEGGAVQLNDLRALIMGSARRVEKEQRRMQVHARRSHGMCRSETAGA